MGKYIAMIGYIILVARACQVKLMYVKFILIEFKLYISLYTIQKKEYLSHSLKTDANKNNSPNVMIPNFGPKLAKARRRQPTTWKRMLRQDVNNGSEKDKSTIRQAGIGWP